MQFFLFCLKIPFLLKFRGMIIPDDKAIALKNMIGSTVIFGCFSLVGMWMFNYGVNSGIEIIIACVMLFIASILIISKYGAIEEDLQFAYCRSRWFIASTIFICALIFARPVITNSTDIVPVATSSQIPISTKSVPRESCLGVLGQGSWVSGHDCDFQSPALVLSAHCTSSSWAWDSNIVRKSGCDHVLARLPPVAAGNLFKGKTVSFCGDSQVRDLYHAYNRQISPKYNLIIPDELKHSDMTYVHSLVDGTSKALFQWNPRVNNISSCFNIGADYYVLGASLWDALWVRNLQSYTSDIKQASQSFRNHSVIWVQPHKIVDRLLRTPEKLQYMNEATMNKYREAVYSLALPVKAILDPLNISSFKENSTDDGIHYYSEVNDAFSQLLLNALNILTPRKTASTSNKSGPKAPDSMSFSNWGIGILTLAFVMLVTMDSFFGIGWLSLKLAGRSFDYMEAYGVLLSKSNKKSERKSSPTSSIEMHGDSSKVAAEDNSEEKDSLLRSPSGGELQHRNVEKSVV